MNDQFIPGLGLNEGFFFDVVKPILDQHYPGLAYSASLIGSGSDVLGLDTAMSMDHDWGPRLQLFLPERDFANIAPELNVTLRKQVPVSYKGFPTNFTDKREDLTQAMLPITIGPVNHRLEITTVAGIVKHMIGFDLAQELALTDWLTFPEQRLIELTRGKVYYDGLGELTRIRDIFSFYPDDIWLGKMAVLWYAIGEEEAFIGRNHDLGNEIGEQILTARIVSCLMKLCFYLEKQYVPYSKWIETCFRQLNCGLTLNPLFSAILNTRKLREKEANFAEVYHIIGDMHNILGITEHIDFSMTNFYSRPYQVLFAGRIADALKAAIKEPSIKHLNLVVTGVEQLTDGIDITAQKKWLRRILG